MKQLPALKLHQLLVGLIIVGVLVAVPLSQKPGTVQLPEQRLSVYQIQSAPLPYLDKAETQLSVISQAQAASDSAWHPDTITATAAAVIDVTSGSILFEKNGQLQLSPASTTKLMTALIARELYDLEQIATISAVPRIAGASIGFVSGEQITVADLLRAALIQSGNEAAVLLAEQHPDGADAFIARMNQKARELELDNTHFTNVMGFDGPEHYSTARDLALLSKTFMADDFLRSVVGTKTTSISDTRGWYTHQIWNTHQLLDPAAGIVGIKTGTTDGALEVLITQLEKNDRTVLVVILGSQDRYKDTSNLLEWVTSSYRWLENPAELE